MTKTHWKKYHNPDFLGAWDFQPKETKLLTIKSVGTKDVYDPQSRKKEPCAVLNFSENVNPMVLNVTNSRALEGLFKSAYVEDWVGGKVALRVEQVRAFGQMVDAVRVTELPELTPNHPKWDSVAKAIQNKDATIEQAKTRFVISPENEKLLCKNLK